MTSPEASKRPRPTPEGTSEEERRKHELPVDRGWAWVVSFSGFLCYFITGTSSQCLSVMFVEVVQMFDASITLLSLAFMAGIFALSITSVVATNVIVPKIGVRTSIVIGGSIFATSSCVYAFAPNIWVFIGGAVIKGFGAGFVLVPGISFIRLYFHRRRFLATTIAHVGASVAVIAVPPVIRLLRKEFGVRGTFLIVSAVELHMVAAGLLMRPIEVYKYRPVLQPLKKTGQAPRKDESSTAKDTEELTKAEETTPTGGDHEKVDGQGNGTSTADVSPTDSTRDFGGQDSTKKLLSSEARCRENGETTTSQRKTQGDDDDERLQEIRRFASVHSLADDAGPDALGISPASDTQKDTSGCCSRLNGSVLGLWTLRLSLLSTFPSAVNQYVRTYVPTIANLQGATLDQGAILLTLMGSVDLVSRLLVGLFADTHILKPSQILIITQLFLGILCQFLRFFTTFTTLIYMAIGLGLFIGTRLTVTPMLSLEVAGLERMPQAYSITAMVATFSGAAINPLFGAIVESTGDFVVVFHIIGVCFLIGAVTLVPMPLMVRWDKQNGRRKE